MDYHAAISCSNHSTTFSTKYPMHGLACVVQVPGFVLVKQWWSKCDSDSFHLRRRESEHESTVTVKYLLIGGVDDDE
eukprot:scaffold275_cov93-Cylindrotheca_fusiformis.AAC.1